MKQHTALNWLVPLIAVIAVFTAGLGLFAQADHGSYTFTTLHGNTVEMYGQGIYRYDSLFSGAAFQGTDAVMLFVGIPLLVISYLSYRRGSLRGSLLMIGTLLVFLYNSASMAFAAHFNSLFLFYTALFSASLFAVIAAFTTFDIQELSVRISSSVPRRGMAIFMFVAGLGTLGIWMSDVIGPIMAGTAPVHLGPYTTMFTHAFDSAVITPACVIAGIYLLQKRTLGYLLSVPLLILCTLIGIVVIAQTVSQTLAGIVFPIGVYIGMIGSWVVMGAFAISLTVQFFRNISKKVA
jgi:hypothetical protein